MTQNGRNQSFSFYFCMMIEGSGSIPLTNGSGMPKNMWIRIRIRIRNTGSVCDLLTEDDGMSSYFLQCYATRARKES
jgi:hypothetical protein